MLYLTTGANGAGKTLFTLQEVHAKALKENRPVCYNGRFDLVEDGPLKSWKRIDIKDWQAEPDGTIFFVDECHNDFPVRSPKEPAPEYVRMLAEHRRRGFDFYLLTQHPQNIDVFVRRLIGSPGWHRHLKRTFGAALVSQLEWSAVNAQCEKPGSGASGAVSMRPFPTEVYSWYRSAQLHTGKTRIPRMVWVGVFAALAAPVLAYYFWQVMFKPNDIAGKILGDKVARAASANVVSGSVTGPSAPSVHSLTVAEYLLARTPRLDGFAHTAPVYDGVTAPAVAPYPAACVIGHNQRLKVHGCTCYSQQGTMMVVPDSSCRQIATNGFFVDWALPVRQEAAQALVKPSVGGSPTPVSVVAPAPVLVAAAPISEPIASDAAVLEGAAIGAMRQGKRRW